MLNYLIFVLVLVINIFFELFFKDYELKNNEKIIIEQGMNLSDVSKLLKNNNIIKSKLAFKIWIKVNFVETKIKFGEYQFENGVSVNKIVSKLKNGDFLGWIGDSHENGNWVPHLHFQILLSLLDIGENFPGVGYQKHIKSWKSICPDPDLIIIEDISTTFSYHSSKKIFTDRKKTLVK